MKKNRLMCAGTLLCAMALMSSCSQDEMAETVENSSARTFTLTAHMGADSRTTVDGLKVLWSEGDQIYLAGGTAYARLPLSSGANQVSATFEGSLLGGGAEQLEYAVYPAMNKTVTAETGGFKVESNAPVSYTFPTSYTYPITNAPMAGIIEATLTDSYSVVFKQLGSLLRIPIEIPSTANGEKKLTLTASGIVGEAAFSYSEGKCALATINGTASDAVTLDFTSAAPGTTCNLDVPIPAGTYTNLSVTITMGNEKIELTKNSLTARVGVVVLMDEIKNLVINGNTDGGWQQWIEEGKLAIDGAGAYHAYTNEALKKVLEKNEENLTVVLEGDLTKDIKPWDTELNMGGESTKTITIDGNGHTLTFNNIDSDWNWVATNANAKLIIKNATLTNNVNNGPWNHFDIVFRNAVELENVTTKNIALEGKSTLKNVTVNPAQGTYAVWITADGQTVDIDGLTITKTNDSRGIAIKDEYREDKSQLVTLSIKNSKIASETKAAILVTSKAGATINIENVDITEVAADTENAVWVDSDREDYFDLVTVNGGTKMQEQ